MSVHLSAIGNAFQFFNSNGRPLSLGKLYTYVAGTTTPAATYTDPSALSLNPNPIILDASGRLPNEIWLNDGIAYKFVLQDALSSTIGTYDNISGINDVNVSGLVSSAALAASGGSALVGFLASGGTLRTVQSKLRDFVSVKDFGAVGDGVTNDLAAITAGIAALSGAGGTLYFPAGTYLVTARIQLVSGVTLQGAGMEATKIINTAGSSPSNIAIDARGVLGSNYTLAGPAVEGANSVTTAVAANAGNFTPGGLIAVSGDLYGQDYVPLFITTVVSANAGTGVIVLGEKLRRADVSKVHVVTSQVKNIGVRDMSITQTGDVGIVFKYVRNGFIERVYFASGIGTAGTNVVGSRDVRVLSCTSDSGKTPDMHSTWDSVIGNCVFRSGSLTLEGGCDSVAVLGNRIYDPPTWGMKADTQCQRCQFIGNSITNVAAGQIGIFVDGSAVVVSGGAGRFGGHIISENGITGATAGGNYGVSISGASLINVVTNNRIEACGLGISAAGALSTQISGNICFNCTTDYSATANFSLIDTAMVEHIRTGGGAPTIAIGAGAGAGSALISGTDTAGSILITTGAGPAASANVATVTFRTAWNSAPEVTLVPTDATTAALSGAAAVFVKRANTTQTKFEIWVGGTPLGQPVQFNFSYHVIQAS